MTTWPPMTANKPSAWTTRKEPNKAFLMEKTAPHSAQKFKVRWQPSTYMHSPCSGGFVLAFLAACIVAGCSQPRTEVRREFSLGTNGTVLATVDSQHRIREFSQFKPDRSLKLKVSLIYGERDIQKFLVFDSQGREVWKSTFTSNISRHVFARVLPQLLAPMWGSTTAAPAQGKPPPRARQRSHRRLRPTCLPL